AHGLADYVAPIVGRTYANPQRMKPDPAPILDAISALGAEPAACVLVGDSVSDIDGARAAGVCAVGYANRPYKLEVLRSADMIITTMRDIVTVLSPESPESPESPRGDATRNREV